MRILEVSASATGTDVAAVAESRLRESPYYFLKYLNCEFEAGVLTLRGRVPFGQLRQFAEAIVGRVPGVREIVNRIEVIDPARGQFTSPAARSAG